MTSSSYLRSLALCLIYISLAALSKPVNASNILHIIVPPNPTNYYWTDQKELVLYLGGIPGMNITIGYLYPCGLTVTASGNCADPFYQGLEHFDQIWVTDISTRNISA